MSEFLSAYYLCAKANSPSFLSRIDEGVFSSETILSKQDFVHCGPKSPAVRDAISPSDPSVPGKCHAVSRFKILSGGLSGPVRVGV